MKYPLVSIITVSLNAQDTIEQTIMSVISHRYQGDVEYIIIDGGSTDGTLNVIEKYLDRIDVVVSEKDSGVYEAINKGIKKSHGEIIGLIHATDWYTDDAIEISVDKLLESNCDISVGLQNWYSENELQYVYGYERAMNDLWFDNIIPHLSTFVRKSVYNKVGLYDEKYQISSDYKFFLECYLNGIKFEFIDKPISNFREGGKSKDWSLTGLDNINVIRELTYKYKVADPDKYIDPLFIRYGFVFAEKLLKDNPDKVLSNLKSIIPDKFSMWGFGKRGRWIFDFLKRVDYLPEHIVDKQYKNINSNIFFIESLDTLNGYDGTVLIAIDKMDDEIMNRIRSMRIQKYVDFMELVIAWGHCYYELEG